MKKMPIKKALPIIIALIIVGGGAFYSGMKYSKSKCSTENSANNSQGSQNLTPQERQQRFSQMGGGQSRTSRQLGGGAVNGEIISKDDQSITVKLRDGGSKIVFYSDSTGIEKSVAGSSNDLEVGKTVIINGSANQDGSVTAQSIQLRPDTAVKP